MKMKSWRILYLLLAAMISLAMLLPVPTALAGTISIEVIEDTSKWHALSYYSFGQSFTATATGKLTKIYLMVEEPSSGENWTNRELTVYDGDGIGGTVLGTATGITLSQSTSVTDWKAIDLSSLNISVTFGNVYTFYFTNTVCSGYSSNGDGSIYAEGSLYVEGTNYTDIADLYFKLDIEEESTPTVSTVSASSITANSAVLGGNVTDAGTATVTERGVVYSYTDATPTIGEPGVTKDGNGWDTGVFSETISLYQGATYYVCAYATNRVGTSYGSVEEFTTLWASMSASPETALTEENLDSNSLNITLKNVTFADSALSASNFVLNGSFTGLSVESVSYTDSTHCTVNLAYDGTDFDSNKAFSLTIRAAEMAFGGDLTSGMQSVSAAVETEPSVTTATVTTYGTTSAAMGGDVMTTGGEAVTERGVVYSNTDSMPVIGEPGVTKDGNGSGTGEFSETVSGLAPNTTYYLCAYATNCAGTSYGAMQQFTTDAATVSATSASALAEGNLDTNSLDVTLSGITFADSTLSASNFVLKNAPDGVTVQSVSYTDPAHCTVNLAFDGTDFDTDVTNFSLIIRAAELAAGTDLTTDTLKITAAVEPLALASSVESGRIYIGGRIVLTPNAKGGQWDWDEEYLSATFNSPATFTGRKAGTTRVTYTVGGESTYYDITIEEIEVPQTGQDMTWVWILAGGAALALVVALTGFRGRIPYSGHYSGI